MIDIKKFNGIMDTDSPNENIGQHSIKMGRNIKFRGKDNDWEIQNLVGNTLIPNNLPAGTNECCGAFFDDLKGRILYCNFNSNATHGIYIISLDTRTITPLLINGTSADSDCLDFDLDEPIYEMKMLYGDADQGDTLYFNDSSKVPCQINIDRTLAGTYGTFKRSFLEVIKYPANRPPYVVYGDDATVTVNTLRKKLFIFKTRPVYFSREKAVTSMQSELPLPINAFDTNIDKDPTKNCKISIVYETLDADVEKIEILGAVSGKIDENGVADPNSFSDFFLIQTIDKSAAGLGDNDIAIFEFKNDQAYIEIDPEESIQLFDLVPLEANALEFLNGNVPIYGGITEGFDLITVEGSVSSSSIPEKDTQLPYIFAGSQSGDSAFGTGNIHIVVVGTIAVGYTFTFITTNQTVTFVATVATTANVITGLSAAAVIAGFTVVSSDSQNLVISQTGESLQIVVRQSPILSVTNGFAYNWNDKHAYCANYFDKAGRTAGSQTIQALSFQTVNYTETLGVPNIPQVVLSLSNRPPIDAFYFTIGRTKSLAKEKTFYWITDTTYKDSEFAWISIASLKTYIEKYTPNANHLAYDFAPGDRVRFVKVLSGSVNTIYTDNDFEIVGQKLDPIINSVQRTGQFLKIALPTTSSTFDFGSSDFYNYQVELYTPAKSVANNLNKYYEFGERYTIGDPGLSTRYHQGMSQNQTSNLSQPALFVFNKGPLYYRDRTVNIGAEYNYVVFANEEGTGRTTLGVSFQNQSYSDPNITPGSSPSQGLAGFNIATNTDRAILNVTTGTYNFRIKGSINVNFNDFGEVFSYYLQDSNSTKTYLVGPTYITQGPHIFEFDKTFQMLPNSRMFIFAYSEGGNGYHNSKTYSDTDVKITRELPFTIPVMDANYSDYFASAVNSNGRALIEEPLSKRAYNPVLLRWGLPNIINTNINQVSRFTVLNFQEIDSTKGDIEVMSAENRILNILQRRGCGWFGIYAKIIQDNSGKDVLVTTDDIITKNNIQYLAGNYGIGSQKGSFAKTKLGYFFTDEVRGYQVRRSMDGLIPITQLYYGQYFIGDIITKYNNPYLRVNGSISKILGYYDGAEEQYVVFCQAGTFDGDTIPDNNFSFNEERNGYCSFYDFNPDWIISAQNMTYAWKDGQIYAHDNTTNYGNFFGVQTYPSVTIVFNLKEPLRRTFNTLSYQSPEVWESPENGDITTSEINEQTGLPQISALIVDDYKQRGNYWDAGLLRDANSMEDAREALLDGDYLEGQFVVVKLTYFGSKFVSLYSPYISNEMNPRNF